MKDLKTVLSSGIETNNMNLVRDFYLRFFGEEPPVSSASSEEGSVLIGNVKQRLEEILELFSNPKTIQNTEVEVSKSKKPTKETSTSSQQFISSDGYELPEDSDPTYKAKLKKIGNRKKHVRDPYSPNMKTCGSCNVSFDFNKEYPAGVLQSDRDIKIKCSSCKRK